MNARDQVEDLGLPLFEWPARSPARARRTDPASSHRAADRAEASGAIRGQARLVAAAVVVRPGLTTREIATFCGLDRYQVARRAPELEAGGWLEPRKERTEDGHDLRLYPTAKARKAFGGAR